MIRPIKAKSKASARINPLRWSVYATAGVATAITGARTAEADIIYSGPINRHFNANLPGGRFALAGGATLDATYVPPGLEGPAFGLAALHIQRLPTAGSIAGFYGHVGPLASKLSFGQSISSRPFVIGTAILAVDVVSSCPWLTPGTGFVGFRFSGPEGQQYGWARIATDGPAAGNTFTLIDYAVADPGERITAGQTSSTSVPESGGSLGLLALGCAGLLAWHAARRESAAQA